MNNILILTISTSKMYDYISPKIKDPMYMHIYFNIITKLHDILIIDIPGIEIKIKIKYVLFDLYV